METSQIETKFKEILYIASNPEDLKLQFILLIHSINLCNDLKCTGLLEDDSEGDFILPPNWNKDSEGVYSFRYFDPKAKDSIYFKFVTEGTMIYINAVLASKNDKINSIDFNLGKYPQFTTEVISEISKRYHNEFLCKILPDLKPKEEDTEMNKLLEEERRHNILFQDDVKGLLWNIPSNQREPDNPFGDFGRSDLFPNSSNPINPDSRGNVLGPRNPIFHEGPNPNLLPDISHPRIRYDPTGPLGIDPTTPDPDINFPIFPGQIPKDPKNPYGGGPFGKGGFGDRHGGHRSGGGST